jgi:hypothetical protein
MLYCSIVVALLTLLNQGNLIHVTIYTFVLENITKQHIKIKIKLRCITDQYRDRNICTQ